MDINIRQAVLQNLSKANADAILATIEDAMTITEEKVLPGLGVMFEEVWKRATPELKNSMINNIVSAVN
jgi:small acid-soluble spore protein I (minor)